MTRVLIASSSRADVTALASVAKACVQRLELVVDVVLTGRHVLKQDDYHAAQQQFPKDTNIQVVGADLGGANSIAASAAMGQSTVELVEVVESANPDVLLVLGDRLDMMPVVFAALPFNIPIAHLHGGDLTYGALDDRIRHAVTKLAHIHFTANAQAAARVCSMGEEPWRVQVVGAPALDSLLAVSEITRADFSRKVGLPHDGPFILATVHPETNSADPLASFDAVLRAAMEAKYPVLFTAANADMGGMEINSRIKSAVEGNQHLFWVDTLGERLFANALRHASLMLGNSSSGIVEAGAFGLPVVDVGERQAGRLRGANVLNCPADATAVSRSINAVFGQRFDVSTVSLYGDGRAAERIAEWLQRLPDKTRLLKKVYFSGDASFSMPWSNDVAGEPVSRASTPENAKALVTRSTIVERLAHIGVSRGSVVCVHSSLSRLGFVVGGSRTVIEALLEVVGRTGTVVMPSFSGDLSDPGDWRYPAVPDEWVPRIREEMPGYVADRTQTRRMGAIAEHFRSWPRVQRSPHPQSSFSAVGPDADYLVGQHPMAFRFGPNSPLGRLEEVNARILLMAAPRNTASILYLTQGDAGPIQRVKKRYPLQQDGRTMWVEADDIVYENFFFPEAIGHLVNKGLASRLEFEGYEWLTFQAKPALSEIRHWRRGRSI